MSRVGVLVSLHCWLCFVFFLLCSEMFLFIFLFLFLGSRVVGRRRRQVGKNIFSDFFDLIKNGIKKIF